jgi:hypothetical protein
MPSPKNALVEYAVEATSRSLSSNGAGAGQTLHVRALVTDRAGEYRAEYLDILEREGQVLTSAAIQALICLRLRLVPLVLA